MKKKKTTIKLWGDHIVLSSLFLGLLISLAFVAFTFGLIEVLASVNPNIATNKKDLIYAFGTLAILIAFIINNLWIKPQRNIIEKPLEKDVSTKEETL